MPLIKSQLLLIQLVLQQSYEVGYTYSYYYATDGKTEVSQATCPM